VTNATGILVDVLFYDYKLVSGDEYAGPAIVDPLGAHTGLDHGIFPMPYMGIFGCEGIPSPNRIHL
jgi:hypothetical protein